MQFLHNSIQCTSCQMWVHRKCRPSGIKGSMYKVMKSFVCRGCMIPVTDIGVNAYVQLVDKFCYLLNVLNVDGDADAAVKIRSRIGWNKFRHLVPLLTNNGLGKPAPKKQNHYCETNLDLLEQETVSSCGISWAICKCKSAPRLRQITMPAPNRSFSQGGCPLCHPTTASKH